MAVEYTNLAAALLYHGVCHKGKEILTFEGIYRQIFIQPTGETAVKLFQHGIGEAPAVHADGGIARQVYPVHIVFGICSIAFFTCSG